MSLPAENPRDKRSATILLSSLSALEHRLGPARRAYSAAAAGALPDEAIDRVLVEAIRDDLPPRCPLASGRTADTDETEGYSGPRWRTLGTRTESDGPAAPHVNKTDNTARPYDAVCR